MKKILLSLVATVFFFGLSSANAMDMKGWGSEVMKKVAKYQKYPPAAITRELEGRATVSITVSADGTILNSQITSQTEHKILNREIPKIIAALGQLPALPEGKSELTFTLPLVWALR